MKRITICLFLLSALSSIAFCQFYTTEQILNKELDKATTSQRVLIVGGSMTVSPSTSPTTVNDARYLNKTSSGSVAGLITGVTSATITVSANVTSFGFLVKDSVKGNYISIQPTGYISAIKLTDGDADNEKVEVPQAMTFNLTNLQLTTTVQYNISAVK